ncbi:MAG: hypothetical protein Q4E89_06795 [Eubacteriales bacterium]|nr:hypothetical protein [Eubacteriales bacterium]
MEKQILRHIQTVSDMERAHIPYTFVKKFGEERCAQVSRAIIELELPGIIRKLSEDTCGYFMKDSRMVGYLKQMEPVLEENALTRLQSLFYQAGEEKLTEKECRDVQEVLLNEEIPIFTQYWFLKYFKHRNLNETEQHQVYKSLEKYRRWEFADLEELSDEERMILAHPLFTTSLLDCIWSIREAWTLLLGKGVLPLLQMIYANAVPGQRINENQLRQLAEKTSRIQILLQDVLTFFTEDQRQRFLSLWLGNNVLLKELEYLAKLLPDMGKEQKEYILSGRLPYACCVYRIRMEQLPAGKLNSRQEQLLIYAVVTGKKHFLKLADENSETFLALSWNSLLLDPDIYRNCLNLNTLNERNLKEGCCLEMRQRGKQYLGREAYTFEELKVLAPLNEYHYRFYDLLANERSDERLRTLREFVKRNCILFDGKEEETQLQRMACRLSEKPLSVWIQRELGHIKDLDTETALRLLAGWEDYQRFVPELSNGWQAMYLVRNKEILPGYKTLADFQSDILRKDKTWLWLESHLDIPEEFTEKYEGRIRQFVCRGEANIVYQLCEDMNHRLVTAELMGAFEKLKYHEGDLEKEIAFPVSEGQENLWKQNLEKREHGCRLWEEDRFIPVLQIGEIPMETCISYRGGVNKNCLLSCFDANKKVIYFETDGKIVFRALIRLTKGSVKEKPVPSKKIEFADLTKETKKAESEEELVLFLERPYFGGISENKENGIISRVFQMVQEKAEMLQARIVISNSYRKYEASKKYELTDYYVYISASKNGQQYLDSLGGKATVSDSGTYGKNSFLVPGMKKEKLAA